jgi:alpha-glucosidase
MTAEAVHGYEMITFNQKDADAAAAHMVMCAFARNAFDPMDFTPVSLDTIPKIKRRTSVGFELATAVIFLSGIQHYVEGPEGMTKMPAAIKKFMQDIPANWDDVRFIDGYPGKYYVVARRAGTKWYVAGINGDTVKREITMDWSFLRKAKTGTFFHTKEAVPEITPFPVFPKHKNKISMEPNDGFVIVVE